MTPHPIHRRDDRAPAPGTGRATPTRMPRRAAAAASLLTLALVLGGCAPASQVILLPQTDGRPSAVEVRAATGTRVLDQPYQTASVSAVGLIQTGQTDADSVRRRHPVLIDGLASQAPVRFTLTFETGTTALTAESRARLPEVLAAARERAGGEIVVTGHTDTVGRPEANDALSLQRARAIRELLLADGFPAGRVEAVGRGEREPAVPTADEVAEPRNRRVELLVR